MMRPSIAGACSQNSTFFQRDDNVPNILSLTVAIFLSTLVLVSSLFSQDQTALSAEANSPAAVGTPLTIGTTFRRKSEIMEDEREVNVWLPPSYAASDNEYPVLYVIDGGVAQDFHHISGLAQLSTINGSYDEFIVIGIQTSDRVAELCSEQKDPRYLKESPKRGNSDRFLKYVKGEVIPFVEGKYRTNERRAVVGESLAGLFITEVFLQSPDTFTDYISISPSLWWDDKALAKSASELLTVHDEEPRQLYLTMGDEGGTMQKGLEMVLGAIEANKPGGLTLHYVDRRKTEVHATIYHPAVHDALRKLFGKPLPDYGPPPWYLLEGGQPADDLPPERN